MKHAKFWLAVLLFLSLPFMAGVGCNESGAEFGSYGEATSGEALGGLLNALEGK